MARHDSNDTTRPGKASRGLLNYQGARGGAYPPPKTVPILRGKSRTAQRQELGLPTGTSRPGFPELPVE